MLKLQHLAAVAVVSMLLVLIAVLLQSFAAPGHGGGEAISITEDAPRAPEFGQDRDWINVSEPLTFERLRGKVVLLDFWTYCCINCMHVLPDLRRLEQKYSDELVVIGVHSGKFDAEENTDNIRAAVKRYGITHPVVNDPDMEIWRRYGVRSWPTLILIDPTGGIVFRHSGEGAFEALDAGIARLIEHYDEKGTIDRRPISKIAPAEPETQNVLRFPGKVLFDEVRNRLFIADSGHNRIVVTKADGEITAVIGDGQRGLRDGAFTDARFNRPQGMAIDEHTLYVADTDNHTLREVDLARRTVTTVLGTGRQADSPPGRGAGTTLPLNSPWDLTRYGKILYIAMAGSHQIWRANTASWYAEPYAGSGKEGVTDASLPAATLAQPSAIDTDGRRLYFADSEASAIRTAGLGPQNDVSTIVGAGLFEFGDRDGPAEQARMQHPLGLAVRGEYIYVADTYNNKIRRIDLTTNRVSTVFGTDDAGGRDGANAAFDEPGGIDAAGDRLYIADTNNHVIRIGDLRSGTVNTLHLSRAEAGAASGNGGGR